MGDLVVALMLLVPMNLLLNRFLIIGICLLLSCFSISPGAESSENNELGRLISSIDKFSRNRLGRKDCAETVFNRSQVSSAPLALGAMVTLGESRAPKSTSSSSLRRKSRSRKMRNSALSPFSEPVPLS